MDTDYDKLLGLMESFGVDIEKHGKNEIMINGGITSKKWLKR